MARLRVEIVGVTYHVNNASVDGVRLVRDDHDRLTFLRMFHREAVRSDWCVLMYALLTNHFHVVLRLREPTLSSGFRDFESLYARTYNRRHGRRGALWQRRFYDSITETDSHLYESIRYVALNAPRANLCERPEEWAWCSYAAAVGVAPRDPIVDEEALLGLFAHDRAEARTTLRGYVEEGNAARRLRQTRVRLESDARWERAARRRRRAAARSW
jgi:hypothetical protein